jgi:hypothetical protein
MNKNVNILSTNQLLTGSALEDSFPVYSSQAHAARFLSGLRSLPKGVQFASELF